MLYTVEVAIHEKKVTTAGWLSIRPMSCDSRELTNALHAHYKNYVTKFVT